MNQYLLEQKAARLESKVAECATSSAEDSQRIHALEDALVRVAVRECKDKFRFALKRCEAARDDARRLRQLISEKEAEIKEMMAARPAEAVNRAWWREMEIRKIKRQLNVANRMSYRSVALIIKAFAKRERVTLPMPSEHVVRELLGMTDKRHAA